MNSNWTTIQTTLADFTAQYNRGEWVLDPEHQRDVVHDNTWKSDIINSGVKIGDIPQVYFHTQTDETGLRFYESLDGKQRCTAFTQFLNDEFKFKPDTSILDQHKECKGKKFSEFHPLVRQQLAQTQISCKIFNRAMTDEEISEFFLVRQVTKVTTLGEKLNAQLNSRIRPQVIGLLDRPTVSESLETVNKNGNRKHQMELLVRLMYVHHNPDIKTFDPSAPVLIKWFTSTDPFSADELNLIDNNVQLMVTLVSAVPPSWNWTLGAKTTLLPVYNILRKNCNGENLDTGFAVMVNRLSEGQTPIIFKGVDGDHNTAKLRLKILQEACFP